MIEEDPLPQIPDSPKAEPEITSQINVTLKLEELKQQGKSYLEDLHGSRNWKNPSYMATTQVGDSFYQTTFFLSLC